MWENVSLHSVYVQYVCVRVSVFWKRTIISSVCHGDINRGYSGYSPNGSERCPKASEHHGNTHY